MDEDTTATGAGSTPATSSTAGTGSTRGSRRVAGSADSAAPSLPDGGTSEPGAPAPGAPAAGDVVAETRPGWYRNTGPTALVIQPPVGPTLEVPPARDAEFDDDGQLIAEPVPAGAVWLLDDLHHPHLAFAGDDPAGPDTGTES